MVNKDLSSSLEDYLEAIYVLAQDKQFVHANKIAEYLKVGKSSVSWALKQLSKKGLVDYTPYEAISLTDKGHKRAEVLAARHEGIKSFLTDVLAINDKVAEENACRMEHVVDKSILKQMKQFMDFLSECPRAGLEWMKGFGHFCQQGRKKELCSACVASCQENLAGVEADGGDDTDDYGEEPSREHMTVKRLREVLAECGRDFSAVEQEIARGFLMGESHQTVDSLYEQLADKVEGLTRAAVDKTLQTLCELKIARMVRFRDHLVYEHLHPEAHHDHLFCVKCGAIVEFFDPRIEALQMENSRRADFRLLMHNLNIYGLCKDCIRKEGKTRLVTDCMDGELVQVSQLLADEATVQRLKDMGLQVGRVVQVLSGNCTGDNVILMVGGTRLMLDCETARQVKVLPTDDMRVGDLLASQRVRHRHSGRGWRRCDRDVDK